MYFVDSLVLKKLYNFIQMLFMVKEVDLFGLIIWFVQGMKNIFMNVCMMSGENMIVFINKMLVCGVFMVLILFGQWEG